MDTTDQVSTSEPDDGAHAALDLSEWTRLVGESIERSQVPERARLLFARAERGMARGLRVAATRLDHVAFQLDCAGRRLEARGKVKRATHATPSVLGVSADESVDSMADELLSPHLA